MQNKRKLVVAMIAVIVLFIAAAPAFAYASNYNYTFETKDAEEFVTTGKTYVNYDGEIPDYCIPLNRFFP